MKLYLLLISMLLYFISFAQLGFQNHIVNDDSNDVTTPNSICSSDLDGDGDLDILIAARGINGSWPDDKILWYDNLDGQGKFGAQRIITTDVHDAKSAFAADLDGDGDMDVLSTSRDKIAWYENLDGLGDYGDQQIIVESEFGVSAGPIIAADMDGDNDMDVIYSRNGTNNLFWVENTDGLGDFSQFHIVSGAISTVISIIAKDLDGDGDMDLIATSNSSGVVWYENIDGQGTFGVEQIILTNIISAGSTFVTDLDGDTDLDILVSFFFDFGPNNDPVLAWYENLDGQATFGPQQDINANSDQKATSIYASDVDGDGDKDVIAAFPHFPDQKLVWYENLDGQGDFGFQQIISNDGDGASIIDIGDIDGDNDVDIFSAVPNDDEVVWYENINGAGDFELKQVIATNINKPNKVISADIDSDNDMDLLTSNYEGKNLVWYENLDGQGTYSSLKVITSNELGAHTVSVADFDDDGDVDVIASFTSLNDIENEISWYENLDGQGTFGPPQVIETNLEGSVTIAVTDIDNDDDIDVVASYFHEGRIVWFENTDGQGNFGFAQLIEFSINFYPYQIKALDIDNDGDMDVVYSASHSISWIEHLDGQGSFDEPQNLSSGISQLRTWQYADIEGDGDLDIIAAALSDKIVWFENVDGQGNFGPYQLIASNAKGINSLSVADFDGDSDLDIISGGFGLQNSIDEVTWYEHIDGHGIFSSPKSISTNPSPVGIDVGVRSIITTDVDNDGDMDAVSASYYLTSNDEGTYNTIAWHENLGLISNKITGKVSLDMDANGCDDSDIPFHNVMIYSEDGVESLATFSLQNGYYQIFPGEGTFVTSVNIPDYYSVDPASYTSNFAGIGNTETADFCLEASQSVNNLNISLFPIRDARPGFTADYQLVFQNIGTTQLSGDIVLEFDGSKLEFSNASETVVSQTANTITFNYNDLNLFESRTIDVEFNVLNPPIVNIDDTLSFTASIYPIVGDYSENDNVFSFEQTVIGSYDPNDIRVLEGDKIRIEDIDNYLHYIIRFQNTGTAEAFTVRIENLLDNYLDWQTIQMQSASHAYRVEIMDGNEVSFIFDNINLPDSTSDEANSHGFIAYKIKPKSDTQVGAIISNKADIFFDFNPAIETNTVTTEIISISSTEEFATLDFTIYPIPTEGILSIKSQEKIARIEIYDRLGQLISANSSQNKIDISFINPGLYFCKVIGNNSTFGIEKIIKN